MNSSNLTTNAATAAMAAVPPQARSGTSDFFQWLMLAVLAGIIAGIVISLYLWAKERRSIDARSFTSAHLAVFAALLGVIFGLLGAIFSKKNEPLLDVIVACVSGIFVIQIGEILRHHSVSKKMQSLERALDSEMAFSYIHAELDFLESIRNVKARFKKAVRFIEEIHIDSYNRFHRKLHSLAQGIVEIDEVTRELSTNNEFLRELPSRFVRAVSYLDGHFFQTPEGKKLLNTQSELVKNGIANTRIFILTGDPLKDPTVDDIMQQGNEYKITCLVVTEATLRAKHFAPEDFVIYDDIYVRRAQWVGYGGSTPITPLKTAVLLCGTEDIKQYEDKWVSFEMCSEPADKFFAPTKVVTPSAPAATKGESTA